MTRYWDIHTPANYGPKVIFISGVPHIVFYCYFSFLSLRSLSLASKGWSSSASLAFAFQFLGLRSLSLFQKAGDPLRLFTFTFTFYFWSSDYFYFSPKAGSHCVLQFYFFIFRPHITFTCLKKAWVHCIFYLFLGLRSLSLSSKGWGSTNSCPAASPSVLQEVEVTITIIIIINVVIITIIIIVVINQHHHHDHYHL